MKLILIGLVGSGKSTQGNLLSKQLGIPYLSTGDIFRAIAQEKTKLAKSVRKTMQEGKLISDAQTVQIVGEYLGRDEYKKGYILDGFPRTINQVKEFGDKIHKVIYVKISDKEALWRLAHRRDNRADDTIAAILKRISVFHEFVEPVISHYRKKKLLIEVDGAQSIEGVNRSILAALDRKLDGGQVIENTRRKKVIIALVGLAGSGKTEAGNYIHQRGIPRISFGNLVNDYIDKRNLLHTEPVHKKIREELRSTHGFEAFAKLNAPAIDAALKGDDIVLVEGLYSWEEYEYLIKNFPKVTVILVALFTPKGLRYQRGSKRKYRPGLIGKTRDIDELVGVNKGAPIAYADYLIVNDGSLEVLHERLDTILQVISSTS